MNYRDFFPQETPENPKSTEAPPIISAELIEYLKTKFPPEFINPDIYDMGDGIQRISLEVAQAWGRYTVIAHLEMLHRLQVQPEEET